MGGTLRRLHEQGHEVTVVYQTSGNLAVPDEEATMASDLLAELTGEVEEKHGPSAEFAQKVRSELIAKSAFETDSESIRRLKRLLRRGEARASLQACGLNVERVRFLDLEFYERGRYRQFSPGKADLSAMVDVLREINPQQVFVTGDRDDPSSVTAACFDLVRRAFEQVAEEPWCADSWIWLYRGVDFPWEAAEIDMAVPLSPTELALKTQAIYHHKSQRSQAPVSAGLRESWQQAEQHNRQLAETYDRLGLANYEAIEAFQRWHP
jgi:glucosamine-6-phosphate deaminase